ncbi:MAG: hypothetical protein ABI889_02420 [Gemmatimonadota bacterium]
MFRTTAPLLFTVVAARAAGAQRAVGMLAITKFLTDVMSSLSGARMTRFESECFDIHVTVDWASEAIPPDSTTR